VDLELEVTEAVIVVIYKRLLVQMEQEVAAVALLVKILEVMEDLV
jgi:hypothetical protein